MEPVWNGWGSPDFKKPLPKQADSVLTERLGTSLALPEIELEALAASVSPSRLSDSELLTTEAKTRIKYSRGQSLPDWLALKYGELERVTDAVAFPKDEPQLQSLLELANQLDAVLIPYGGGTSVVGHINPGNDPRPTITVSMEKMNQLLSIDPLSQLARFQAGVRGPDLEKQLNEQGYTLGHFPQSFEWSTLGGWIASRSSGQQSLKYGRIEQLFAGGTLLTPGGKLVVDSYPASSAGPDWRELILGSEGRLGIISEAEVRVQPLPEKEQFYASFFPSWQAGLAAVRQMAQQDIHASMFRLSHPTETLTQLQLALEPKKLKRLQQLFGLLGLGEQPAMLTWGVTGNKKHCRQQKRAIRKQIGQHGGRLALKRLGDHWQHNRFGAPYLRQSLWEKGYLVDTFETAANWNRIEELQQEMERSLAKACPQTPMMCYTHLSHVYAQGCSLYTTYLYPNKGSYEENLERWQAFKKAASQAVIDGGGTISHQHGVGEDHRPYFEQEKSKLQQSGLTATLAHYDPDKRMNPGKLISGCAPKETS